MWSAPFRLTAGEIQPGDAVARARTHDFRIVASVEHTATSVWINYEPVPEKISEWNPTGEIGRDRPRQDARWWAKRRQ